MFIFQSSSSLRLSVLKNPSYSRPGTYLRALGSSRTSGSVKESCLALSRMIPTILPKLHRKSYPFGLRLLGEQNKALCPSSHYSSFVSPNKNIVTQHLSHFRLSSLGMQSSIQSSLKQLKGLRASTSLLKLPCLYGLNIIKPGWTFQIN